MPGSLATLALAQVPDGAGAWAQFVRSAGRALTGNQALAPWLGLGVLLMLVILIDWKFAGWLERLWRRRHKHG